MLGRPRGAGAGPPARPAAGTWLELTLPAGLLAVALGSGALTLLAEAMRSALDAAQRAWSRAVSEGTGADAGRRYEFGTGKLEQAGCLCVSLTLVALGLWVAGRALGVAIDGRGSATPLGLALAATVNAPCALRAGYLLRVRPSAARAMGLASLLIAQTALTVAATLRDPALAALADSLGAICLGLLMTAVGGRMLWEAMLDLIDHPLRQPDEAAIARLLRENGIGAEELVAIRARRAGRDIFVELTFDPAEGRSVGEIRARLAHLRRSLEAGLGGLDLTFRLSVAGDRA
jgi:ferrous-iron efflux pump FieF